MENEHSRNKYTPKQSQYLAYIYCYTKLNGRPPAEVDMQRHFSATPPTVHDMIIRLEKKGFIERKPGTPRSIRLLLPKSELPDLI
jgi:repressor LexA